MTGQIFVLSRDRVIFWVRFSSVVQKRFRRLEGGEIMSIILLTRDSCREQTLEVNACVRTVAPKEVDENQDTFAVSSNY